MLLTHKHFHKPLPALPRPAGSQGEVQDSAGGSPALSDSFKIISPLHLSPRASGHNSDAESIQSHRSGGTFLERLFGKKAEQPVESPTLDDDEPVNSPADSNSPAEPVSLPPRLMMVQHRDSPVSILDAGSPLASTPLSELPPEAEDASSPKAVFEKTLPMSPPMSPLMTELAKTEHPMTPPPAQLPTVLRRPLTPTILRPVSKPLHFKMPSADDMKGLQVNLKLVPGRTIQDEAPAAATPKSLSFLPPPPAEATVVSARDNTDVDQIQSKDQMHIMCQDVGKLDLAKDKAQALKAAKPKPGARHAAGPKRKMAAVDRPVRPMPALPMEEHVASPMPLPSHRVKFSMDEAPKMSLEPSPVDEGEEPAVMAVMERGLFGLMAKLRRRGGGWQRNRPFALVRQSQPSQPEKRFLVCYKPRKKLPTDTYEDDKHGWVLDESSIVITDKDGKRYGHMPKWILPLQDITSVYVLQATQSDDAEVKVSLADKVQKWMHLGESTSLDGLPLPKHLPNAPTQAYLDSAAVRGLSGPSTPAAGSNGDPAARYKWVSISSLMDTMQPNIISADAVWMYHSLLTLAKTKRLQPVLLLLSKTEPPLTLGMGALDETVVWIQALISLWQRHKLGLDSPGWTAKEEAEMEAERELDRVEDPLASPKTPHDIDECLTQ